MLTAACFLCQDEIENTSLPSLLAQPDGITDGRLAALRPALINILRCLVVIIGSSQSAGVSVGIYSARRRYDRSLLYDISRFPFLSPAVQGNGCA